MFFFLYTPVVFVAPNPKHLQKQRHKKNMEICVKSFDGEKYTVEVGVDDTTADIRRKVASAAALCEDSFHMSFGGKVLDDGHDTTQLSSGDTVVLLNSQKHEARAALRELGETRLVPERFEGLTDPKLIHLFLQAEVVTKLPPAFLAGGKFEELDLSGVSGVTTTGANLLCKCTALHTADLSGWSSVTLVECAFLNDCSTLRTLDLSGWSNVTHIENSFLHNCPALAVLDLSGWRNVTHIGSSFLSNCRSLRTLDVSMWKNVTSVDVAFLYSCRALKAICLGWRNVTQVGSYFLSSCSGLTTLDLSGWRSVAKIDDYFLSDCTALTSLNLSGWHNVSSVGDYFVANCSELKTLDWSGWANVTRIGYGPLLECTLESSSINVTGSSIVVSEYVHSRSLKDDEVRDVVHSSNPKKAKRKCVCM